LVKPYNKEASKKNEVRAMFNNIARNYDFLNHFLSFGIDVLWRKKLIKLLRGYQPASVLDIATGTGDLAIMAAKSGANNVVGIDLAAQMIAVGKEKIERKALTSIVELKVGDAEQIQYNDQMFDAATVAFGVRNFENLEKGLLEINRVLKSGRPLLVLEFAQPTVFPIKQFYHFYSFYVLPIFGRIISKDERAYQYLPESIKEFPSGNHFIDIMERSNYTNCRFISLSFGIANIYIGEKNIS
jgi:demethylmenaquinone methyltransferase / 2-methoxy-6-polyprenyl-1,4-benzoquinol methylase